jgi:hypothetical protein
LISFEITAHTSRRSNSLKAVGCLPRARKSLIKAAQSRGLVLVVSTSMS